MMVSPPSRTKCEMPPTFFPNSHRFVADRIHQKEAEIVDRSGCGARLSIFSIAFFTNRHCRSMSMSGAFPLSTVDLHSTTAAAHTTWLIELDSFTHATLPIASSADLASFEAIGKSWQPSLALPAAQAFNTQWSCAYVVSLVRSSLTWQRSQPCD